jgi:hypothetical protein
MSEKKVLESFDENSAKVWVANRPSDTSGFDGPDVLSEMGPVPFMKQQKLLCALFLRMRFSYIQGILALCEFHYYNFSKHSINIWLMRFLGYLFH